MKRFVGILIAAVALLLLAVPVGAQSGYDFEITDAQSGGTPRQEAQWYEIGPEGSIRLYFNFDSDNQSGCITGEFEYSISGSGASFQSTPARTYLSIDDNDFNTTEQSIDATGDYVCTGSRCLSSDDTFDLLDPGGTATQVFAEIYRNSGDGAGSGTFIACVESSDESRGAMVRLHVGDPSYFSEDPGNFVRVRFWYGMAENYCPDGTEAITETVTIAQDTSWTSTISTTYDAMQVRYIISRTNGVAPSYLHGTGTINGVSETFNQNTDQLTVTVPSAYGVYGPTANLEVANTGGSGDASEFDLISACVVEAESFSYCRPGETEVLTSPVQLENWDLHSGSTTTAWDQFAITFYVTDYNVPDAYISVNNSSTYLMRAGGLYEGTPVSWTLPLSPTVNGGFSGPDVDYELRNAGAYDFTLASVCISETQQIDAPVDCNLYNNDFITSTTGWDAFFDTTLSWSSESNGAADITPGGTLSFGAMTQDLDDYDIDLRGAYEVEARVRSSSAASNTIRLYAQISGNADAYYETYTTTISAEWENIAFDFYMLNPDLFTAQASEEAVFDWICIRESSPGEDWRPEVPACVFPTFSDHPTFSITSLLSTSEEDNWLFWLANKVGELADWVVCMIERIIMSAVSMILDAYDVIGLPSLPEDVSIGSLIVWLREVYRSFGLWLGESLQNMLLSGRNLGEWARDQLITLAEWLWEDIIVELITWLMDQAIAAGLIGERTAQDIQMLFRNLHLFLVALGEEIGFELQSAAQLGNEILNVFGVLISGVRSSFTGTDELDMGEDLGGFANYLWRGVELINDVVESTPLAGLNIVALGAIAWGLSTWTLHRFRKIIEYLASFGS
jgi:hypothetical protein